MKNEFICLAKSQKYNGRCVAGVLIGRNKNNGIYIQKDENGNPKWVRPVSYSQHGEINDEVGSALNLLDVYEIDNVNPCPDRYQSENVHYNHPTYVRKTRVGKEIPNLDACCDNSTSSILFVNRGKAISEDQISNLKTSIKLVKVSDCSIYVNERDNREDQYRMKFTYNGKEFDLPMTDLDFRSEYDSDNEIFDKHDNCYISVSIGVVFNEWYYKLVASVILV
jgi:hypothetical protein